MTTAEIHEEEAQVCNFYRCPKCSHKWQDTWSCACNDTCPHCSCNDVEPYESTSIDVGTNVSDFSDAVKAFGVDRDSNPYAIAAVKSYAEEGEIEIDDCTVVSMSEKGAYVMAWLWVSEEDIQPPV